MKRKQKLFYQPLGNSWAVGVESDDPQAIISQDYSWYNHGAYNGELHYMSERFAYIWTTEENLKKYFYRSSLAYFLHKRGNSLKEKVRRYARMLAKLRFGNLIHEPFIKHDKIDCYSLSPKESGRGVRKDVGYFDDEEEWKQTSSHYYLINP